MPSGWPTVILPSKLSKDIIADVTDVVTKMHGEDSAEYFDYEQFWTQYRNFVASEQPDDRYFAWISSIAALQLPTVGTNPALQHLLAAQHIRHNLRLSNGPVARHTFAPGNKKQFKTIT